MYRFLEANRLHQEALYVNPAESALAMARRELSAVARAYHQAEDSYGTYFDETHPIARGYNLAVNRCTALESLITLRRTQAMMDYRAGSDRHSFLNDVDRQNINCFEPTDAYPGTRGAGRALIDAPQVPNVCENALRAHTYKEYLRDAAPGQRLSALRRAVDLQEIVQNCGGCIMGELIGDGTSLNCVNGPPIADIINKYYEHRQYS